MKTYFSDLFAQPLNHITVKFSESYLSSRNRKSENYLFAYKSFHISQISMKENVLSDRETYAILQKLLISFSDVN